jgi:hypothetical protein
MLIDRFIQDLLQAVVIVDQYIPHQATIEVQVILHQAEVLQLQVEVHIQHQAGVQAVIPHQVEVQEVLLVAVVHLVEVEVLVQVVQVILQAGEEGKLSDLI